MSRQRCTGLGLGVALVGLALIGCGKNRVMLTVDVASFLSPADRDGGYDAPPVVTTQKDLEAVEVTLDERFADFSSVEELDLEFQVDYDNQTGTGDARFTLYFHDDAGTLYATPEVATVSAVLYPGQVTRASARLRADERVRDLFLQERLYMGVRNVWTPQGTQALLGDYHISQIVARVVSHVDVF
jgi:hypothetical protein